MHTPGSFVTLTRTGYMEFIVPYNVMVAIKNDVDRIFESNFTLTKKHNYDLAGAIEKEYQLKDSFSEIESFVSVAATEYFSELGSSKKNLKYKLGRADDGTVDLWVNFQKRFEYNPLHKHGGVLSFVIWYQIPYDIEEERKIPIHQNPNECSAAAFTFVFPDHQTVGGISELKIIVDKSKEGHMIIFPASLRHSVNPFYTSDEYRISISGNLVSTVE
jgi:hypothetical protein